MTNNINGSPVTFLGSRRVTKTIRLPRKPLGPERPQVITQHGVEVGRTDNLPEWFHARGINFPKQNIFGLGYMVRTLGKSHDKN